MSYINGNLTRFVKTPKIEMKNYTTSFVNTKKYVLKFTAP